MHSRHRALMFLLRAALWIVVAIPLLMIADVLFQFSEKMRLAGLLGVILAMFAALVTALCMAVFIRPPLLRIARLLETRNPALGSKLINFLQLESESHSSEASALTRSLALQAVGHAGQSVDAAALPVLAREPGLPRQFFNSLAAPVLLLLLTLVGGMHVRHEWLRFLDPFGDHPPFSLTSLSIEKPLKKASVLYGGSVVVEARAAGHVPRELFLTAVTRDGSQPPLTLPMTSRGDGGFVASLEDIRQPLQLTVHLSDGGSRSHHRDLDVILTPQIGKALVRLSPPAYTGQPPRELPFRFAGLQALEGTEISFQIESNRPLGIGKISLLTSSDSSKDFPFAPATDGPAITAQGNFTATSSGKLSFSLIDIAGNSASHTPTSALTVTRDQPPGIALTIPDKDAFVVEDFAIPIIVDATDDYGLRSVRLHISVNGNFLPVETVDFESPDMRRHQLKYPFDLAKSGAKAGDEIVFFAEAIDTRPDPQLTRTNTRRLAVITEEQYNDFLRKQADVALISGKYEALSEKLRQKVEAQRAIEDKRKALLNKPADDERQKEFAETIAEQEELNQAIDALADEMKNFGRENPVYDFEKDLQKKLQQQAETLKQSTNQNRQDNATSGDQLQPLADAAQNQRERLEGGKTAMREDIIEPLEDLSLLHELIKDFNRFKILTEDQKQLAEQTKAYEKKEPLSPEDKLALRAMGAVQRQQAQELEGLERKLRHDALAAKEKFPKAAGSARNLADQIGGDSLPGMARNAAGEMLAADAPDAHSQARQLYEKMNDLFCDACQNGQQSSGQELDNALTLTHGMSPGNSFQQMMQSLNFRPSPNEGKSGSGSGGFMASSAQDENPQVIGGESLTSGPIVQSLAGRGDQGGGGVSGAPTATLDKPDESNRDQGSARRTNTPASGSILLEYEKIADAYFRRLTNPNPP